MPQGWTDIAPQELWPWLLIGVGVVGLGVIILLVTLIVRQRDTSASREPRAERSNQLTPAQQRTLERDVSNLIAALSEMAQDVGARLDERALRLEKLIDAADERLRRLEQADDRCNGNDATLPPSVVISHPLSEEPDPRHAEIYALADQGLSVMEIAQRLAQPKGEVELILALRPRRAG